MDLTDFQQYYDYFLALSQSHVDINGFHFGDKDVMINDIRSALQPPVMWLEPYQPVDMIDPLSDNHIESVRGTLAIYDVPASEKFDDMRNTYKSCEIIVKDIIAKLLQDYYSNNILLELSNIRYGEAESLFSATKIIGCRLDFNFMRPARLVFDPAKWQ